MYLLSVHIYELKSSYSRETRQSIEFLFLPRFFLIFITFCSLMTCKSVTCKSDVNWQINHIIHKKGIKMSYTERVTMLVLQISSQYWVRSHAIGMKTDKGFFSIVVCWISITILSSSIVDHLLFLFFFFGFLNSRLRVIAELRHGDLFHSANIVSRWIVILFIIVHLSNMALSDMNFCVVKGLCEFITGSTLNNAVFETLTWKSFFDLETQIKILWLLLLLCVCDFLFFLVHAFSSIYFCLQLFA